MTRPFHRPTWLVLLSLSLLPSTESRAGSVAYQTIPFGKAVAMSARIVKGTVTGRPELKLDGATFHSIEIAVERVLKGTPSRAGERVRIFRPGEWFQHTHAAAIRGGVVSYSDPHYATPVPDEEIKPGAVVIAFLAAGTPPAGFPANAAFLICGEAYERVGRENDVSRIKAATFGDPFTLKMGETAVLPDGLELEVKGHSHKRPVVGGPHKEMAELEARVGTRARPVVLGHVIEPDGRETWEKRTWDAYDLDLLGMKYDAETILRVQRRKP